MVFVMEKMKEQSSDVQPVFGLGVGGGGGGLFNGLDFSFILEQVLNQEVITLSDDDDAQLDAEVNIPPMNITNFPPLPPFNPIYSQFPTSNFPPFTTTQLQPLTTDQSNEATETQQLQPNSILELVNNAIQQLATQQAFLNNTLDTAANGANNVQPPQSTSGMMQNNTFPHALPLLDIPSMPGEVSQAVQYQALSDMPGSVPNTVVADQPQLSIPLPSNNEVGLQIVVWQPPPINIGDFSQAMDFSNNPDQQQPAYPESTETSPNLILNNAQEAVPTNEESNLSETLVNTLQAPLSSTAYPLSPSELSVLSEYEPSVGSNIVIVGSTENSVDADDNQSNHANIPN